MIGYDEGSSLSALEGKRFISSANFEKALKEKVGEALGEESIQVVVSAYTQKGIPARLTTFIAALVVAVFSTLFIPSLKKKT